MLFFGRRDRKISLKNGTHYENNVRLILSVSGKLLFFWEGEGQLTFIQIIRSQLMTHRISLLNVLFKEIAKYQRLFEIEMSSL